MSGPVGVTNETCRVFRLWPAEKVGAGKDAFTGICSECHALDLATSQKKPRGGWQSTVDSMVAKGATASKEQLDAIVTYLAAHFAQLRGRRGEPTALGAIRHDLLVAYYHVVRDQVPFRELGPDWQRKRYSPEHRAQRLQRQLEKLGYTVTLEPTDPAEQAA